jgi:hypothetical protein
MGLFPGRLYRRLAAVVARWTTPSRDAASRGRQVCASPPRHDPAADRRAQALLLRMLSRDQCAQWEAHGFFQVDVAGRGTFRILPRATFNVVQVTTGECYCGVCPTPIPIPDLMLAQKLLLELAPERFFAIANRATTGEFVTQGVDVSARARDAAGRADRGESRVRCSMVSMLPHASYIP